ncbi:MAG: DUF4124 domain-containing protein [Candidatus Accumulibacter sp.]|uniref:DUF4124 domain-containing protein n=1 Tax=Candidatus Accumulibacter proximus TaxID=2954385 RepID=A0A935PZ93_9PROT|nr:DUF4124 domain-containing protein [Candidatus Accumulibacter proximus]
MRPPALLFALLAVATAASGAGVYKWVDEKGVTHFSGLPPPGQQAPKPQQPREVPKAAAACLASRQRCREPGSQELAGEGGGVSPAPDRP